MPDAGVSKEGSLPDLVQGVSALYRISHYEGHTGPAKWIPSSGFGECM